MEYVRCGFVTASMELSEAELRRVYGRDYFHGLECVDYVAEAGSLKFNFERRLTTLEAFVGNARGQRLSEIGCRIAGRLPGLGMRLTLNLFDTMYVGGR
jgi:hypothetical protein